MPNHGSRERATKFARIEAEARGFGLEVVEMDWERPWGGFLRFEHDSLDAFRRAYWEQGLTEHWDEMLTRIWAELAASGNGPGLDAKLLLLAPGERLSLQSHARRSELWRVLEGPVTVAMGPDPETLSDHEARTGEVVYIPCGRCHRGAASATGWAIVAEFWRHEDPDNPSTEADVVRYADDYDR
jgi:mannose-6-phosphate isomerase-like protein (cupin superfamily)